MAKQFNRISLLPISFYCPTAGPLSEAHGAGRSALMSSFFHAVCAGQAERAKELRSRLTAEEYEQVSTWEPPSRIVMKEGDRSVVLDYADAEKEVPVALTSAGNYADYDAPEDVWITRGTLDLAWVRWVYGKKVAFVADLKRGEFTVPDGPDTLQVHAYGQAYAGKVDADAYVVGLWYLETGEWEWMGEEPIDLDSKRAADILEQIRAAAANTEGKPVTGPHCRRCYGRRHCGEHMLPAALADTWLAPLARGETRLTPENAAEILLRLQGMQDLIEPVKEALKHYVNHGGRIEAGGKTWEPVNVRGREGVRLEAVRQLLEDMRAGKPTAELLHKYGQIIRRGNGHQRFDWRKRP